MEKKVKFDPPLPPHELYVKLPNGEMKLQVAHACAHCLTVKPNRDLALVCCKQTKCLKCGTAVEYAFTICSNCREQGLIEKATDISETPYDGPVYDESGDEYHADMESLLDHYAAGGGERPEYVFACTVDELCKLDPHNVASNLTERLVEDHHENAYDELVDLTGLGVAIGAWLKQQVLSSWYVDYKRKIKVPAEEETNE